MSLARGGPPTRQAGELEGICTRGRCGRAEVEQNGADPGGSATSSVAGQQRWQAGGGSSGRPVGVAAADKWADGFFYFFYILQKCLPSVGFIYGKLFAECL